MATKAPSEPAVKTLFALSRNQCFYTGCEEKLTDPKWKKVKGQVAHIKGEHPGSARYDEQQSDRDRQEYPNLMLLCPNCHKRVDDLEPDDHPVERLLDMKERHVQASQSSMSWASDSELGRYALMAIRDAVIASLGEQAALEVTGAQERGEGTDEGTVVTVQAEPAVAQIFGSAGIGRSAIGTRAIGGSRRGPRPTPL